MKIGIVLSKPPAYSETFFVSKINGLLRHQIEVILFVQKGDPSFKLCRVCVAPKIYKNKIIQIFQLLNIILGIVPYRSRIVDFLKLEKQSGRSAKQRFKNIVTNAHLLKAKVDWLHFGFTTLALQSDNVAQAIGAKMALSCRGYDMDVFPLKHKDAYNLLWKNVDKVHTISNYMKEKALEYGMKPETLVEIITPALELDNWQYKTKIESSKTIQITTIARLHWIKGLMETLEALALLKKRGVHFQYQIIGSGSQYEALSFAIFQLGLTEQVKLMGQLKPDEVNNHLQSTQIYLQYSHSEGFCNAVLEAQAMGCLCIVSDGGALPENVVHNQTGIVVPKGNPKKLANAIDQLIKRDEEENNRIVLNARSRVKEQFSLDKQIQQFMDFYAN